MTVTKWSKLGFSQVDARNWKSVSKIHVAKSLLQLATDIRKITFWSCAFFLARVWTNSSILSQKVGRDYLPSANNWLTVLETCWRAAHRMKRRVCFFFLEPTKNPEFLLNLLAHRLKCLPIDGGVQPVQRGADWDFDHSWYYLIKRE